MLTCKIQRWTQRHYLCWIDRGLADIVVRFDVVKIHRVSDAFYLIQLTYIVGETRVILYMLEIGFKVAVACPVIISPLAVLGFLDQGETHERQEI